MTALSMDFHSSEWKFRAATAVPRSTPDGLPLVRVELHRADRRSTA